MEKNYDLLASKKKIWTLIGFFIVGWIITTLGFALMNTFVDVLKTPIMFILGMVVLAFPSIKLVWAGARLRELFNTDYIIVTTYADGHQTKEYDTTSNMIWKIIYLIIAIALGVVITPIRVLLALLKYNKVQKEIGITNPSFTEKAWFPLIVTGAVFILMIIISSIIISSAENKHFHKSDYSDEEVVQIINTVQDSLKTDSFDYEIRDTKNAKALIEISYTGNANGGKYVYTVGELEYYDYDTETGEMVEKTFTEADSKIPWGTYTYENGAFAETLSDDAKQILLKLQFTNLFDLDYMKNNLSKYVVNNDDDKIKIHYYYNGEKNDSDFTTLELFKDTKKISRLLYAKYFESEISISLIEYK